MSEKIIISFDDENPEKPEKAEEKIIIDFKAEPKEKPENKVISSEINSQFRGNPYLTRFEEGNLKYPEGLENGFRKIYSQKLKDNFLNSILLNNRFVILASANGSVYFVERFEGKLYDKISFAGESFEKTGIVINNKVYINSVKALYGFDDKDDKMCERELYRTGDSFYIWSNLNKIQGSIFFIEYSLSNRAARLTKVDCLNGDESKVNIEKSPEFSVKEFLFDSLITFEGNIFVFYDDKIMQYDFEKKEAKEYNISININADTNFILLDGKIYFNNKNNELFYFDIKNEDIRFTGIKSRYINSMGGFGDNVFTGTLDGWHLYKTTGVQVFSYEDINGNRIESVNRSILAVSNENKIIFHNLSKFQEAEGFTLTQGQEDSDKDKIVSARIGEDMIFVLTKSGIFEAFSNDKLNLFI